jgi:hypothetical protein
MLKLHFDDFPLHLEVNFQYLKVLFKIITFIRIHQVNRYIVYQL